MKLKVKGRRFDTIEEIQAETQKVLHALTEKNFQDAFQNGGDGETGVYMWEGTTSRVTAAYRAYSNFMGFTAPVRKNLDPLTYLCDGGQRLQVC